MGFMGLHEEDQVVEENELVYELSYVYSQGPAFLNAVSLAIIKSKGDSKDVTSKKNCFFCTTVIQTVASAME